MLCAEHGRQVEKVLGEDVPVAFRRQVSRLPRAIFGEPRDKHHVQALRLSRAQIIVKVRSEYVCFFPKWLYL